MATVKYSFEIPPVPIPVSEVKETVTKDIVVLGGGASGTVAAASSAESGAKTILLEKHKVWCSHGGEIYAINTQEQLKRRIKTDVNKIVQNLVLASEGYGDSRLFRKWADTSGPVADWLLDIANKAGVLYIKMGDFRYSFGIPDFQLAIAEDFFNMLVNHGKKFGLEMRFNTQAVQLIRQEGKGRVTGVIAKNEDGSYSQINASKAVIICTGDHGNNSEMMEKYAPWALNAANMYLSGTNTGDGLQMALWIGAAVQDAPHCNIMHFNSTNARPTVMGRPLNVPPKTPPSGINKIVVLEDVPYLYVNKLGERFANEGMPLEYFANIVLRQPDKTCWQVFDSKSVNYENQDAVIRALQTGEVLSSNTLEELAPKFGADPVKLIAAVSRYNELVKMKKDPDFGKDPRMLLTTVNNPPFYVCESPPDLLVCTGGPMINTEAQVLDTNYNTIPGLYAAGNVAGGFWGHIYPTSSMAGMARGLAVTFGRIAGLNAANLRAFQN